MSAAQIPKSGWQGHLHRIHQAASKGDIKALQAELKQGVAVDLATRDSGNRTPLMMAASSGKLEAMKMLLSHKASVAAVSSYGRTALHWAERAPACAELLLEHKADIDKQHEGGETLLIMAVFNMNEALVKLLLQRKANTALKDSAGRTAWDVAIHRASERIVQLLMSVPEAPPAPFPNLA